MSNLVPPYGSPLVNLLDPSTSLRTAPLAQYAATLLSIQISPRSQCDLELLATGAFTPLHHDVALRSQKNEILAVM